MPKRPLYIQLEPGAYPKDIDWQIMSAADRGCYHSLIVFLACNDGKLRNDFKILAALCNVNEKLFENFWSQFSHKFISENGHIEHRRLNSELKKARKMIRQKSLAGKASGKSRRTAVQQPLNGCPTGGGTGAELSKVKGSNVKISKEESLKVNKALLEYDDKVQKLIGPFTRKEDITFKKIHSYLIKIKDINKIKKAIDLVCKTKEWKDKNEKDHGEACRYYVTLTKNELGMKF